MYSLHCAANGGNGGCGGRGDRGSGGGKGGNGGGIELFSTEQSLPPQPSPQTHTAAPFTN